jgi:hypothetical protein
MERMELVVSDDAQGDDLDMLSEELVQSHLERNIIEPTKTMLIKMLSFAHVLLLA